MTFCFECGAKLKHKPPVQCRKCGKRFWLNPKPCASALISHQGKLLLIQRANEPWRGHWDVPGGFCDISEDPMQTVVREVKEELGFKIRVTGFFGIWMDRYDPKQTDITMNIYYRAVPVLPIKFRLQDDEVSEVRWFKPSEFPKELAFPGHVHKVMRSYLRNRMRGAKG